MLDRIKNHFTYTRFLGLGFLAIILIGALLLCLPVASADGSSTPFINALFTSTSATCVTGLVVYDTYTHWSLFGQLVILVLIQVGGIGFMTVVTLFSMFMKRQIGLKERRILMQSAGKMELGGIVKLIRQMAVLTLAFESVGACVLAVTFCRDFGIGRGLYYSVFHSVSAFCNAGFDLMGIYEPYSSLTAYAGNESVLITVALLIIMGGIGFWVLNDLIAARFSFRKLHLHSKIALTTTVTLVFLGTVLILIFEQNNTLKNLPAGQQLLLSFFQSVSPRTAGFNAVELSELSDSSALLTIIYMFIGGCPGSTAGGVKTTTLFVLVAAVVAAMRHSSEIHVFKRRLEEGVARQACAVVCVYLAAFLLGTMAICALEPIGLKEVLFEVASAGGTVGLSMGITSGLCTGSKLILALLMYGGRIGVLSFVLMLAEQSPRVQAARPVEKILIG